MITKKYKNTDLYYFILLLYIIFIYYIITNINHHLMLYKCSLQQSESSWLELRPVFILSSIQNQYQSWLKRFNLNRNFENESLCELYQTKLSRLSYVKLMPKCVELIIILQNLSIFYFYLRICKYQLNMKRSSHLSLFLTHLNNLLKQGSWF